jgi:hypothetical protein
MFCVRLRRLSPDVPPMFLGHGWRGREALMGDVPSDLWSGEGATADGAVLHRNVRVLCRRLGLTADVVTLRFALGWVKAALDVSGGVGRCDAHRGKPASHDDVIGCDHCASNAYQGEAYRRLRAELAA